MKRTTTTLVMILMLATMGCATAKKSPVKMLPVPTLVQEEKTRSAVMQGVEMYETSCTFTRMDIVDVYFSPYDDCEKAWIDTITMASSYVYVSCFGITNANITKALCDRSRSGVRVVVCTDKMQAGNKTAKLREQELKAAGAEYIIKKKQVLEHNKMVAVDDKYAIIGSWNLSGNASVQDNSICVFNWPEIAIKTRDAIVRIYNRDK